MTIEESNQVKEIKEESSSLDENTIINKVIEKIMPNLSNFNEMTRNKMDEIHKSNLNGIYKVIEENNSKNSIMKRFIYCCSRDEGILRKTESVEGGKEAEIAAMCIINGASSVIKKNSFEYSKTKFSYANLEDLYNAIKESEDKFNENENIKRLKLVAKIINPVFLNILDERNCIATIDQKCIVYNKETLEHVSTYKCQIEILMANMMMGESGSGGTLMQDKGKWITYTRRYAISQLLNISLAEDVEKAVERELRERQEKENKIAGESNSLNSIDEAR